MDQQELNTRLAEIRLVYRHITENVNLHQWERDLSILIKLYELLNRELKPYENNKNDSTFSKELISVYETLEKNCITLKTKKIYLLKCDKKIKNFLQYQRINTTRKTVKDWFFFELSKLFTNTAKTGRKTISWQKLINYILSSPSLYNLHYPIIEQDDYKTSEHIRSKVNNWKILCKKNDFPLSLTNYFDLNQLRKELYSFNAIPENSDFSIEK